MNTIKEILLDAGLRSRNPRTEGSSNRRKEAMQIHGLRKFYDTATTQAGVHPLYVEMLLGHDIRLTGSYIKPTTNDLLEGNDRMLGYVSAINALTISDENKLKVQVKQLEADVSHCKHLEAELTQLRQMAEIQVLF
ncbi:MAG: hypothetical protein AB1351_10505 [Thermoproteota archaeon]